MPEDQIHAEYDEDTGLHRVYDNGELIACVGNIDMDLHRQQTLANLFCEALEALRS